MLCLCFQLDPDSTVLVIVIFNVIIIFIAMSPCRGFRKWREILYHSGVGMNKAGQEIQNLQTPYSCCLACLCRWSRLASSRLIFECLNLKCLKFYVFYLKWLDFNCFHFKCVNLRMLKCVNV